MKRIPAAILVVFFLLSGFARAAGSSVCQGTAILTDGCTVTITLASDHEQGNLESSSFVGIGSYRVTGPNGQRIVASCKAYPGATTCTGDGADWPFLKGDTITITVSLTGAGRWSFSMS